MVEPRLTVGEWQKRLETNFTKNGLVGGSLVQVYKAEDDVGHYLVQNFKGQSALLDSFQGFYIDTLNLAYDQIKSDGWPKNAINYPVALAYLSNLFRRFRACEVLYIKGYPLDAYALMRDTKDRAFMLCAVASDMITLPGIMGLLGNDVKRTQTPHHQYKENRKVAERRIMNSMMGRSSGLSSSDQQNLQEWREFFHMEVHGGWISLMQELAGLKKGRIPQIGPAVDQAAFVIYINRSAELGWMIVRLLPFLQRSERAFGKEWAEKLQILDDSFRYMVEGLGNLGKAIARSFITMMDTKFAFREPFHYFEASSPVEKKSGATRCT